MNTFLVELNINLAKLVCFEDLIKIFYMFQIDSYFVFQSYDLKIKSLYYQRVKKKKKNPTILNFVVYSNSNIKFPRGENTIKTKKKKKKRRKKKKNPQPTVLFDCTVLHIQQIV